MNHKLLRIDDTRNIRLKALSVGPQRKSMYEDETRRTGGTAKEPPACIAATYRANAYVRWFAIICCIIGVANGTPSGLKEKKRYAVLITCPFYLI